MASLSSATQNSRVRQILEIRQRARFKFREAELGMRLVEIERAYRDITLGQTELLRYFPITLIASVESFFRMAVKELIDHGEPYLSNAEPLFSKDQYDYDTLKNMHGQVITIGDLVSHHIKISDLSHIVRIMSDLMGCNFKKKLSRVIDRWDVEVKRNPNVPIIADIEITFRHVAETFRLRHIFCHEIASGVTVIKEDIDKCVEHTLLFLRAYNCLISDTIFPNAPLTQAKMNIVSANEYAREKAILDNLILEAGQVLSEQQNAQLEIANTAWKTFLKASVEIEGLKYDGGSIRPMIESNAAAHFTRERQKHLRDLITHVAEV